MAKAFVSNKTLLKEIHESKKSFGVYTKPEYSDYQLIVEDLADVPEEFTVGQVVRLMTDQDAPTTKPTRGNPSLIAFPPFRHYLKTETGFELVGKGQWKGDLETGEWNTEGKITNELAKCMMMMVERYANKPNWRNYSYLEEFKGNAIIQLLTGGLKFNEYRSQNPFAYYTTTITNAFTRGWNIEKKQQLIRDQTLMLAGQNPSSTMTTEHEYRMALKRNAPELLTPESQDVESEEDK